MTQPKNRPKLRFPEFQGMPEWEEKKLKKIAKKKTTKNKNNEYSRVLTNSASDGIVDQREFFNKEIANKNNTKNYFVVNIGDYVYNPRISKLAPVGPISRNNIGIGIMSPLYTVFCFSKNENSFFEYYFQSNKWHNYLKSISNSGARHDRMSISDNDFFEMPLVLPSLPEQQKIADCLTSLDERISAENDRLTQLKAHKRGLMQKLFPSEGQECPDYRFPEFQNAPAWEEKKLGEVFQRIKQKNIENCQNILTISAQLGLVSQLEFFKKSISSKDISNYYLLQNGDFAYNKSYSKDYPVGAIKRLTKYVEGVVSPLYICFKLNLQKSSGGFYEHYFESGVINGKIREIAQEGARNHGLLNISVDEFFLVKILFPTLSEQQKIADCLSALDDLIAAQNEKIAQLKAHKKGLMQQLFV